jgi:hypothetical protein
MVKEEIVKVVVAAAVAVVVAAAATDVMVEGPDSAEKGRVLAVKILTSAVNRAMPAGLMAKEMMVIMVLEVAVPVVKRFCKEGKGLFPPSQVVEQTRFHASSFRLELAVGKYIFSNI